MSDIEVKQSQIISPWGVGSIVPLPDDSSGIILGLDDWDNDDPSFQITDTRLCRMLGVKTLRKPPHFEVSSINGINKKYVPYSLFPNWYYCPLCGEMHFVSPDHEANTCSHHPTTRLVPERFIAACANGHVDNVPILELIHGKDFDSSLWLFDQSFKAQHKIKRKQLKDSTGLKSIGYCCSCQNDRFHSISDLMSDNAFGTIVPKCKGSRPWLSSGNESCNCASGEIKLIQKGGTNVWFPKTVSSIYIPPELMDKKYEEYFAFFDDHKAALSPQNGGDPIQALQMIASMKKWDEKILLDAYRAWKDRPVDGEEKEISDEEYRFQEYSFLTKTCGDDNQDLYVESLPSSSFSDWVVDYIQSVSLVKKLKETRALIDFSRLKSDMQQTLHPDFSKLSGERKDWLPATQTNGEGIMIVFREDMVERWSENASVQNRVGKINKRVQDAGIPSALKKSVDPAFLAIHTISHLLINQISKDSGYGSSSIRERIYVSNNEKTKMFGVLLYTASAGSEGSWGGLVRQGKPGKFEKNFYRSIEIARWCSADPICISSNGQGPDSCNLAACHNCALLPETCCEKGNRFLDRGVLIGPDPSLALFGKLNK